MTEEEVRLITVKVGEEVVMKSSCEPVLDFRKKVFRYAERIFTRQLLQQISVENKDASKAVEKECALKDGVFWEEVFEKINDLTFGRFSPEQLEALRNVLETMVVENGGIGLMQQSEIIVRMIYATPDFVCALDKRIEGERIKGDPERTAHFFKQADLLEEKGSALVGLSCGSDERGKKMVHELRRVVEMGVQKRVGRGLSPATEKRGFAEEIEPPSSSQVFEAFIRDDGR
ncbi:MAG: hypothetical protein V1746_00600 [bacterium]